MAELTNAMQVLALLDKSNCKKCGMPTCLAFSAAVIRGDKQLSDCPAVDDDTLAQYGGSVQTAESLEDKSAQILDEYKKKVAAIDLEAAARRIGAPFRHGVLTVHCLGKSFGVDTAGEIITDLHVNFWIAAPVFEYILSGGNAAPAGEWVAFRELPDGQNWQAFFKDRCETPFKNVADTNPDFFDTLIQLFSGKQVEKHYKSDVSLVLHPLPRLPLLICYWKPDEGLPSDLNLFFDVTAAQNLGTGDIYRLCTGLVLMFSKIAESHSFDVS